MPFIIMIDNPKNYACPGETIVGKAYCSLRNPRFLEVKLKVIGEECTYYNESATTSPTRRGRCLKIRFLKTRSLIIRRGYFNIGEHKFPFKLTLPMCLPSTYKGKYGYVKYMLQAEMITNPRQIEEDEIEFKVFAPIDLKNMPKVSMVPSTHSDRLATKRWFCFHDIIHMDVKLAKNAFVIGEVINVTVEVANNSSLTISAVTVELYLKVSARVSPPIQRYLTVYKLLASDQGGTVNPHRSKTYLSQLKIPIDAEIPNFQKCNLLSQKAFLEVTAVLGNHSKPKVKVEVELILGHYLRGRQGVLSKNARDSAVIGHPSYGLLSTHPSRPSTAQTVCPYPTDEPTSSRSFGVINPLYRPESSCPYPTEEEAPLLPREMPMPPRQTSQNYDLVRIPPSVGSTAPYPLEEQEDPCLRARSSESMPMPVNYTFGACNSIGFLLPMPSVSVSAEEMRPSAPQLSDFKTPPIADINELEDALQSLSNRASAPPILQLPTPPESDTEGTEPTLTETDIWLDVPPSYDEACRLFKNKAS